MKIKKNIIPCIIALIVLCCVRGVLAEDNLIRIESTWDNYYGLINKGAGEAVKPDQVFEVWSDGNKTGYFFITELTDKTSKGLFVPDKVDFVLSVGDLLKPRPLKSPSADRTSKTQKKEDSGTKEKVSSDGSKANSSGQSPVPAKVRSEEKSEPVIVKIEKSADPKIIDVSKSDAPAAIKVEDLKKAEKKPAPKIEPTDYRPEMHAESKKPVQSASSAKPAESNKPATQKTATATQNEIIRFNKKIDNLLGELDTSVAKAAYQANKRKVEPKPAVSASAPVVPVKKISRENTITPSSRLTLVETSKPSEANREDTQKEEEGTIKIADKTAGKTNVKPKKTEKNEKETKKAKEIKKEKETKQTARINPVKESNKEAKAKKVAKSEKSNKKQAAETKTEKPVENAKSEPEIKTGKSTSSALSPQKSKPAAKGTATDDRMVILEPKKIIPEKTAEKPVSSEERLIIKSPDRTIVKSSKAKKKEDEAESKASRKAESVKQVAVISAPSVIVAIAPEGTSGNEQINEAQSDSSESEDKEINEPVKPAQLAKVWSEAGRPSKPDNQINIQPDEKPAPQKNNAEAESINSDEEKFEAEKTGAEISETDVALVDEKETEAPRLLRKIELTIPEEFKEIIGQPEPPAEQTVFPAAQSENEDKSSELETSAVGKLVDNNTVGGVKPPENDNEIVEEPPSVDKMFVDDVVRPHLQMGRDYMAGHLYKFALHHFSIAYTLDPDNPEVRNDLIEAALKFQQSQKQSVTNEMAVETTEAEVTPETFAAPDTEVEETVALSEIAPEPKPAMVADEETSKDDEDTVPADNAPVAAGEQEEAGETAAETSKENAGEEKSSESAAGTEKSGLRNLPETVSATDSEVHARNGQSSGLAQNKNDLGVFLLKNGNYKEGLEWLNQAIEDTPDNGVYYRNRAVAHFKLGNYQRAFSDAVKAHDLGDKKAGDLIVTLKELLRGAN